MTTTTTPEFHMGAFKTLLRSVRLGLPDYIVDNEIVPQVEAAINQARRDTFDLVREAFKQAGNGAHGKHSRWEFLQYCLTGWVECGHHGFLIHKYDAGINGYALQFTPGLPPNTERREATVTAIEAGDDDYQSKDIERILESGKVCADCSAPLALRDGTWVDRTNAYACTASGDEHRPEQVVFEVTHKTIELGLERIRNAVDMPDTGTGNWERNLTSISGLGRSLRNAIIEADLTNESSQLDVWGYTAIVEIALLNESRYA